MAVKALMRHICGMKKDDAHFRLRLAADLHQAMKSAAETNNRSINAEIVSRLEQTLALDEGDVERYSPILNATARATVLEMKVNELIDRLDAVLDRTNPGATHSAKASKDDRHR
ncbi:MAG: Arc family DNA-binding protein [Aurantimonas endophytica]|uniref:Arc family DNA-binding protein n=1 Tax=Aurantimonas endophytica TaxID=1522175 RepID=UPI0030011CBA